MASGLRGDVTRQIQALLEAGTASGLSDGELLDRSAGGRSGKAAEMAFSALVERHGPMVLRVCSKALGDPHDARDAFQSTFLVLAKKAHTIRNGDSVASWLHGVALRVSAASRAASARRRKHERTKAADAATAIEAAGPDDLAGTIHREVGRLPGRYRAAVVLCYLEGRSQEEAAGLLGCPVGTIKSRLAWSRERLRGRLTRLGLAPASVAVAAILEGESAIAGSVPASWVGETARAAIRFAAGSWTAIGTGTVPGPAASLAKGVIRAMILHKIKVAALAGGVFLAASSAGVMAQYGGQLVPRDAADRADSERLKSLETKLDRLISAIEGSRAAAPPGATPPPAMNSPSPTPAVAPLAPLPPVATRVAATTTETTNTITGYNPDGARGADVIARGLEGPGVAAPSGRIAEIERKLGRLEERIAALERRASTPAMPPSAEGVTTTTVERIDTEAAEPALSPASSLPVVLPPTPAPATTSPTPRS